MRHWYDYALQQSMSVTDDFAQCSDEEQAFLTVTSFVVQQLASPSECILISSLNNSMLYTRVIIWLCNTWTRQPRCRTSLCVAAVTGILHCQQVAYARDRNAQQACNDDAITHDGAYGISNRQCIMDSSPDLLLQHHDKDPYAADWLWQPCGAS